MRVELTVPEWTALEVALLEYGFSTEAGGVNEDDEQAAARWRVIADLVNDVSSEVDFGEVELDALRAVSEELGFSTEAGGANEGNEQMEAQVALLERLISRLEGQEPADVSFRAEPRSRLSELAEE